MDRRPGVKAFVPQPLDLIRRRPPYFACRPHESQRSGPESNHRMGACFSALKGAPSGTMESMTGRRATRLTLGLLVAGVAGAGGWCWLHPRGEPARAVACPPPAGAVPVVPRWPSGVSVGGAAQTNRHAVLAGIPFDVTEEERAVAAEVLAHPEDPRAFARGAAIASGLTRTEDVDAFEHWIDALFRQIGREVTGNTEYPRAKSLLAALHRHRLLIADPGQPLPTLTLATGHFNCVSSAIVYNLFASRLGLSTSAVAEPDHVYSLVRADGKIVAVSTTSRAGFGRDIPMHEAVGVRRLIAGVERETVTNATLLGIAVEDRLAFKLDDAVAQASEDDLQSLVTQAALWRRIILFEPGYHTAHQTYERLLRKLGARLEQLNRSEESFAVAVRAVQAAIENVPEDLADTQTDLAVATTQLMDSLITRGRLREAVAVQDEARKAGRCDGSQPCGPLDSDVRELLIEAVRNGRDKEGLLADALMPSVRADGVDEALAFTAPRELARRAEAVGWECTDAYLASVDARLGCATNRLSTCRVIARWSAIHALPRDPRRAAWWLQSWLRQ